MKKKTYSVELTVVKETLTLLLRAKACEHMHLFEVLRDIFKNVFIIDSAGPTQSITAEELFSKCKDVFERSTLKQDNNN